MYVVRFLWFSFVYSIKLIDASDSRELSCFVREFCYFFLMLLYNNEHKLLSSLDSIYYSFSQPVWTPSDRSTS